MGKVTTKVLLKNNRDVYRSEDGGLSPSEIRIKEVDMIVDTGARAVSLPLSTIHELGLNEKKKVMVTLSDGQKQERSLFDGLVVQVQGRDSVFECIGKPEGFPMLLGQLVLETLDFVVDCGRQQLIPNPEAPKGIMLYEDF